MRETGRSAEREESCEPDLTLVAAVEGTRRRFLSSRHARIKRNADGGLEDKRNARTDKREA